MVVTGWLVTIVERTADMVGFQLLPRRWVVERNFGMVRSLSPLEPGL
jgi:transposase